MKSKKYQLFFIPYAGGDSYSFAEMTHFLPKYINPITVEYPGRGKRTGEFPAATFNALIDDVAKQIKKKKKDDMQTAILGHL